MSQYLLDSNSLITPHRQYYSFDFCETFWLQLHRTLLENRAIILKVVYDEIVRHSNDALSSWIKSPDLSNKFLDVSNDRRILEAYGKVLQYVQECGFYRDESWQQWVKEDVADPWLIAAAMCSESKIVTNEQSAGALSVKHQMGKSPKIPDVAYHFNVECISLFDFMRQMNFQL